MKLIILFYICVFGSFLNAINCNVPVLLWDNSNGGSNDFHLESMAALKSYTETEFSKLMRRNVLKEAEQSFTIIFTEKILTTENLNKCKIISAGGDGDDATTTNSCYKELQSLRNKIVYLSNVENPVKILKSIAYAGNTVREIPNINEITINEILPMAGQFLFVKMSDTDKMANDRFMKKLTEHLTINDDAGGIPTLFIYTGKDTTDNNRYVREAAVGAPAPAAAASPAVAAAAAAPPAVAAPATPGQQQQNASSHPSAILPKQEPLPTQFFDESTVIVYTTATYQYTAGNPMPIVFDSIATSGNVETNVISVNFTSTTSVNTFGFEIHTVAGRWSVKAPYFNNIALRTLEPIGANGNFSYRCSPLIKFYSGNVLAFGWEGIQLQPVYGGAPIGRFGDPWDCVGFTSAGIWGGLFVTILLLSILSVGLTWIMDIRTMDRFDDPKGKTITVTVAE